MNVIEHISSTVIIPLNIFGIDISITNQVAILFLAVISIILFFYFAGKKASIVPNKLQNFAEIYLTTLWDSLESVIGDKRWLPFFCAIFSIILFVNLLGSFPLAVPPSANINFTATLAIIVFLTAHISGLKKNGVSKYFSSFVPSDLPLPLLLFIVPIELVSQIARPFSLAVRLFANVFAGHAVTLTIIGLIFVFRNIFEIPGSVFGHVIVSGFEIFIAFIQAFIFTFLSAFYVGSAIDPEH